MDRFQSVLWFISALCALFGAVVFITFTPAAGIALAVIPVCFAHAMQQLTK